MIKKLWAVVLSVAMVFTMSPLSVFAVDAAGSVQAAGDVTASKRLVTNQQGYPVIDEDGNYTVELRISGQSGEETVSASSDVVLVVDNSGSMKYCGGNLSNGNYGICDVCKESTSRWNPSSSGHCEAKTNRRMLIAKEVSKTFTEALLKDGSYNRVAVIGFSGESSNGGANEQEAIKQNTNGFTSNKAIVNNTIDKMVADGGTNYSAALNEALETINGRTGDDKKRPAYVVFISDGRPAYTYDETNNLDFNGKEQAAKIKANHELYCIGIQLDASASSYLAGLATDADHYKNVTGSNIAKQLGDILKEWADQINTKLAGTEAVIKDIVNTDDFDYVSCSDNMSLGSDGKTLTWNIGDITEEEKVASFKVKATTDGKLYTNKDVNLTYKDINGQDASMGRDVLGHPYVIIPVVDAKSYSGVYDGQPHKGEVTGTKGARIEYLVDGKWTTQEPSRTEVGKDTYKVRSVMEDGNLVYISEETEFYIEITKRPVTITVDDASKFYGEDDPEFTGSLSEDALVNENDLGEISYIRTNEAEAVGTYEGVLDVTYTDNPNYDIQVVPGNFQIETATANGKLTAKGGEWTYDGNAHGAAAKVEGAEGFTIEYQVGDGDWSETAPSVTNVSEGTVTVKVRAKKEGYHNLTCEPVTLKINPRPVTITVDNASKFYGEADPEFTGSLSEDALVNAGDLGSISYHRENEAEAVGTYPDVLDAKYTANENYTVRVIPGDFEIKTATANASLTAEGGEWTYDGNAHGATAKVEGAEGFTILYKVGDGDWSETAPSVTNVSEGTVTVQVKAVKTGYNELTCKDVTLKINPRPVTITVDNASKFYGEADPVFTGDITEGSLVNNGDIGNVSYFRTNNDEAVGTYGKVLDASYKLNDNYKVTVKKGDFEIKTATANASLTAEGGEWTYDGNAHGATAKVEGAEGFTILYKVGNGDWSETAPSVTNVSEGTVAVQVKAVKTGYNELTCKDVTLKINPKPVTITVDNASKFYGEADPTFTGSISEDALVNEGDLGAISYLRTNSHEAVGIYDKVLDAKYTANDNYKVTVKKGDFEIKTATANGKLNAEGGQWVYDGNSHPAKAKVEGAEGFTIEYQVGDGDWSETAPSVTNVSDGVVTVNVRAVKEGYHNLTCDPVTLEVTPLPITITVDDKTKAYGDPDPEFTGKITSGELVDPEDLGQVGYDRISGMTPSSTQNPGTYEKILGAEFEENSNYNVTVVNGDLIVTRATAEGVSVTAKGGSWVYDGSNHYGEAILSDTPEDSDYVIEYVINGKSYKDAPGVKNVEDGIITFKAVAKDQNGNYEDITSNEATIQITPRDVKLTSESANKQYDGTALTKPEVSSEGFVGGEGVNARATGSQTNVGDCVNTISYSFNDGTKESNYNVTKSEGTLTVTPAVITVTADNKTTFEGDGVPEFTGTMTGFVNGEDESVVSGTPTYTTPATNDSPVGEYPINVNTDGLSADNYIFVGVDGTLSVVYADDGIDKDEDKDSEAKTGDNSMIMVMVMLLILASIGGAGTVLYRRKS